MKPYYKEIVEEYRRMRDQSVRDLAYREREIYEFLPRVKDIDKAISKAGIQMGKATLDPTVDLEKTLAEMEFTIKALKQERAILLTENNIPPTFLELQFKCKLCNDQGFIENGKPCKCFKQKLIDRAYKMYALQEVLERENFSVFDLERFSNEPFEGEEFTPKENMALILAASEKFVTTFETNEDNLIFYGITGQGKTFLCNCMAKALLDKGHTVLYQTAFQLTKSLEKARFSNDEATKNAMDEMLFDSDLLIIDDLGTELVNTFTNLELFNVINTRLLAKKKTIISTNLTPVQLKEIYSERIASRLFGHFSFHYFYGKDLRWEV